MKNMAILAAKLVRCAISAKTWGTRSSKSGRGGVRSTLLWRQPVVQLLLGKCIVLFFHSVIAFSAFSFWLSGCKKFLKIPSLVMRTSNVLQIVIGSCQSLRLAYDGIHVSIQIVYSDLPPAVSTSLISKQNCYGKFQIWGLTSDPNERTPCPPR